MITFSENCWYSFLIVHQTQSVVIFKDYLYLQLQAIASIYSTNKSSILLPISSSACHLPKFWDPLQEFISSILFVFVGLLQNHFSEGDKLLGPACEVIFQVLFQVTCQVLEMQHVAQERKNQVFALMVFLIWLGLFNYLK